MAKRKIAVVIGSRANYASIKTYPNPASDYLQIQLSGANMDVECALYSIQGMLMDNFILCGEELKLLNISGYAEGIYVMKIKTENGFLHHKIVVE